MDVVARWKQGLQFAGNGWSGHPVVIDADRSVDGLDEAARPTEVFLLSLCACTGMDVVSILNKMRVAYDRFEVGAAGERESDYPKAFDKIELVYHIWGADIDPEKVEKAISLSMDRYCPVSNTLKKGIELSSRFEINPPEAMDTGGG